MSRRALIIGCGFTGSRTARLLLAAGWKVTVTTREPASLADIGAAGARVVAFDASADARLAAPADGACVLLSVPTLRAGGELDEATPRIAARLDGCPAHVSYLSTTGVYGQARLVDETTPVAPATERQRLRAAAERAVLSMPCPTLVLRPAAIYGPGRGVHAAMRAGRFRLSEGPPRHVSRIHVDDLAAIAAAAMDQGLQGAFPVADDLPATSSEVARFCAELMDLAMPPRVAASELTETRSFDRRVNGQAVLARLGLRLRYPTFREGIPASIAAEGSH